MSIPIVCPKCARSYTVADTAAGKQLRCKDCETVIRIPQKSAPGKPARPTSEKVFSEDDVVATDEDEYGQIPEQDGDEEDEDYGRRRKPSRGGRSRGGTNPASIKLMIPAIGLCLVSFPGLVSIIIEIISTAMTGLDRRRLPPNVQVDPQLIIVGVILLLVLILLSEILVLAGAACMMLRKMRGLAIAGCTIAAIPFCHGCILCVPIGLLTMPLGIWGLIVLAQPDVKRVFD